MNEFANDVGGSAQATLSLNAAASSALMRLLASDDIAPGDSPSYEICKIIYAFHPLGAKIAEEPIRKAQSQRREISITGAPEDELIEAFEREWKNLGGVGANVLIRNTHALSRVYGIAALSIVCNEIEPNEPLPLDRLNELELSFNVLDPLNTAGSLILGQNPNSADFLKPSAIRVSGVEYHPSRACVLMNEMPLYIEWTTSAFGFVGRSVYQRILYPLKTYIQSMITDQAVTEKAALLVMKLKSPGSVIDKLTRAFYAVKRQMLQGAKTGNVISLGVEEDCLSLDLHNVRDAAEFARNNAIKNIASGAPMPASMINQETLTSGFGEGTEDSKQIAQYIDTVREDVEPIYRFVDMIVQRKAWNPKFYESIQRKHPEQYGNVPYETAFFDWRNSFNAKWPNLLIEPDSEKAKTDDIVTKAAISAYQVLAPQADPENKAVLAEWLANAFNGREIFKANPLELDIQALAQYVPPTPTKESQPDVESSHE